jgi:hypothetical protein
MNYTCLYCGRHTTITDPNKYGFWNQLHLNKSTLGDVGLRASAITCPNEECKELALTVELTGVYNGRSSGNIQTWRLLPESEAKVLPNYIPEPIKEDYYEACRIRDLSPKASATLSRRCLQGMIRDFYGISKARLIDEIKALENLVDSDVWDSIESVRKVGNIGAHMEKDINVMVDVEPKEAQLLIGLIQDLITDWYVTRYDRQERNKKIKEMAEEKDAAKNEQ